MRYVSAEIVDLSAYRVTQRPKQDYVYDAPDMTLAAPYWLWAPVFPMQGLATTADGRELGLSRP